LERRLSYKHKRSRIMGIGAKEEEKTCWTFFIFNLQAAPGNVTQIKTPIQVCGREIKRRSNPHFCFSFFLLYSHRPIEKMGYLPGAFQSPKVSTKVSVL
jgi:hypothetical protein